MEFTTLKQMVSSLEASTLDRLYSEFQAANGTDDVDQFVLYLYRSQKISDTELKDIQTHASIELTSFDDLSGPAQKKPDRNEPPDSVHLPGYTTLELIGEGSMGSILLAKDNDLRRKVAYKHIHQRIASNHRLVNRFCTEAQLTAQLEHPGIVPIYGLVVEQDGTIGYAMKLIHGKTLSDLIAETRRQLDDSGKVDERHALPVLLEHFLKVCDAVHYANRKGVIHRDLKPQNIMIGPYNEVYVMDWGIAKLIDSDDFSRDDGIGPTAVERPEQGALDRTRAGELLGTPMYMSPEQAGSRPERLDHRSDLFTLGLILYELVTLRRPYSVRDLKELLSRVRRGEIDPVISYSRRFRVRPELKAIIGKACSLDPDNRYQSAEKLANEIRRYLQGEAIQALPDTPLRKLTRWMAKHREASLLSVAAVLLVSISATSWSLYQRQQEKIESQIREQKISRFLTAVIRQAHRVDSQLLRFQSKLEGLAASTTHLLTRGRDNQEPYYTHRDYADPRRHPPDYAFSPVYKVPISASSPMIKLAPGVDQADVEPLIRQLIPLRYYFRYLFRRIRSGSEHEPVGSTDTEVIGKEVLPVVWAYVGLKEGILSAFPGIAGYPEEYDPRQRPWYRESIDNQGPTWVTPYIDVGGLGWMLPCTTPVFDENGGFLGVAGVEMSLDYVRRNLIELPEIPAINVSYLLDDHARIVARSTDDDAEEYGLGTLINTVADLPTYPRPEVLEDIRRRLSGHLDYQANGRNRILAYYRIDSIGWYLLVEADLDRLLAAP